MERYQRPAHLNRVHRQLPDEIQGLVHPTHFRATGIHTSDSYGFEAILKTGDGFLNRLDGKRVPDHAIGRTHVATDRKIHTRSRTYQFNKGFFTRTDVRHEDAQSCRFRLRIGPADHVRVLR